VFQCPKEGSASYPEAAQLLLVEVLQQQRKATHRRGREFFDECLSHRGQRHKRDAPIRWHGLPTDEALAFQPVNDARHDGPAHVHGLREGAGGQGASGEQHHHRSQLRQRNFELQVRLRISGGLQQHGFAKEVGDGFRLGLTGHGCPPLGGCEFGGGGASTG